MGAAGSLYGVALIAAAAPSPVVFTARTSKSYSVPFVSPSTAVAVAFTQIGSAMTSRTWTGSGWRSGGQSPGRGHCNGTVGGCSDSVTQTV